MKPVLDLIGEWESRVKKIIIRKRRKHI